MRHERSGTDGTRRRLRFSLNGLFGRRLLLIVAPMTGLVLIVGTLPPKSTSKAATTIASGIQHE